MEYENNKKYLLIADDYNLEFNLGNKDYQVINTLEDMLDSVVNFCMSYGLDAEELIDTIKSDCAFTDEYVKEV